MASELEWKNSMELANYPFAEGSDLLADDGTGIPQGIFVDLTIMAAQGVLGVYLSALEASADSLDGTFSDIATGDPVGAFSADLSSIDGGSTQVELDGRNAGVVVFGTKASEGVEGLPLRALTFGAGSTPVVASNLANPWGPRVESMQIGDTLIHGRMILDAGDGLALSAEQTADGEFTLGVSAVGAIDSSGGDGEGGIKNINGVDPNSQGGLLIRELLSPSPANKGDERQMVRVIPTTNGIILRLIETDAT